MDVTSDEVEMETAPVSADELVEAMRQAADDAGFDLEPEQLEVARRLGSLAVGEASVPAHLYLWGAAGRGKTWLLDAYFQALPTERKRRVHFHSFFRALHRSIHEHRTAAAEAARATGEPGAGARAAAGAVANAVDRAVEDLLDEVDLVLFDEFHVHDPGDGTLMIRLLEALFSRDVSLITSSNYPPSGLLPDPVYHHIFEPGIAVIEANMTVVELAGDTDHRRSSAVQRRQGFSRGTWMLTGQEADDELADLGLPRPDAADAVTMAISGHEFRASAARGGVLWFTSAELLERPTSVGDYLAWAAEYDRWVLDALPAPEHLTREARARFVHLIDALCDLDVELHVIAATDRETFMTAETLGRGGFARDAFRTRSRLALLRTVG
ncbi:cell division protein ZapE [Plantibacter flavus]|uniref:cell division protein ZapE n=1 Tax=Plantibacter flavus TaxID=150123 RepID=UPI003F14F1D2